MEVFVIWETWRSFDASGSSEISWKVMPMRRRPEFCMLEMTHSVTTMSPLPRVRLSVSFGEMASLFCRSTICTARTSLRRSPSSWQMSRKQGASRSLAHR